MRSDRRKVLTQLASAAFLAACSDVAKSTGADAAAGAGGDAGGLADGTAADSKPLDSSYDAAVDAAADTSATDSTSSTDSASAADAAQADAAGGPLAQDPAGPTPFITPNDKHYITSCCGTPTYDPATWTLQFVEKGKLLLSLTWAQLDALPAQVKEHTLECIGTGPYSQSVSNALWTGLPVTKLLAHFGVAIPSAKYLKITGIDGYSTGLPASDLDRPLWVVWRMNGEQLPPAHGRPARLLVPGRYGMKNPKWLKTIEFTDEPHKGFWESQGWSDTAIYQAHTYIRWPRGEAPLPAGTVRIQGIAFAGADLITNVQVRVGDGPWLPATVDYAPGPDIWTLWHFDWPATKGTYLVQARCATKSGATSNPDAEGSDFSDGYDGSMAVSLDVS